MNFDVTVAESVLEMAAQTQGALDLLRASTFNIRQVEIVGATSISCSAYHTTASNVDTHKKICSSFPLGRRPTCRKKPINIAVISPRKGAHNKYHASDYLHLISTPRESCDVYH